MFICKKLCVWFYSQKLNLNKEKNKNKMKLKKYYDIFPIFCIPMQSNKENIQTMNNSKKKEYFIITKGIVKRKKKDEI